MSMACRLILLVIFFSGNSRKIKTLNGHVPYDAFEHPH